MCQGEEEFNEWIRSAKAGHPCEDDVILSSEPLPNPVPKSARIFEEKGNGYITLVARQP